MDKEWLYLGTIRASANPVPKKCVWQSETCWQARCRSGGHWKVERQSGTLKGSLKNRYWISKSC